MKDFFVKALDYFANKRYAVFVGVAGAVVAAVAQLLDLVSATSLEVQGVSWLTVAPIVLAFVTQLRVWAKNTVEEIRAEYRARLDV